MMDRKREILGLLSLLKVFDANFVNDSDCAQLQGLEVNRPEDVAKAVQALLLPEFRSYSAAARDRLVNNLRMSIADQTEDFGALFDRVELAFDEEVVDRRAFMASLLAAIEAKT